MGSAKDIADQIEEWFVNYGADGFNLKPSLIPDSLDDFVDHVVPELQKRGIFRREYQGSTLRMTSLDVSRRRALGVSRMASRDGSGFECLL